MMFDIELISSFSGISTVNRHISVAARVCREPRPASTRAQRAVGRPDSHAQTAGPLVESSAICDG